MQLEVNRYSNEQGRNQVSHCSDSSNALYTPTTLSNNVNMMDAFPATKIPRLDSLDVGGASPEKPQDTTLNGAGYRIISGPISLGIQGGEMLPLAQRDHRQLLHGFADFILDFTGDDDISFDFLVLPDGNGRRPAESGAARATISKDQDIANSTQGPASSPFEQRNSQMKICFEPGSSNSDFGIIISNDASTLPFSEGMAKKPFVLGIDDSDYSLRLSEDRIPDPFVDAVVSASISPMSSNRSPDAQTQPLPVARPLTFQDGLSVLNHPPLATPPEFNRTLNLPTLPVELQTNLLHNAFLARVLDHPGRPAIDFLGPSGRITYSYKELDDLSTALARHILLRLGTLPYDNRRNIAALLTTSPELYVAWLAVLKAGCTFCPLPVEAPSELLCHMVEETSAKVVLGFGPSLQVLIAAYGASSSPQGVDLQAFIKEDHTSILQQPYETTPIMESDLAYIMHTSGSTGRPKGVQISHLSATCSIASHIVAAPQPFGQPQQDAIRWFQFAAPTFDPSVMEIFITLSIGGTICSCDRAMMLTNPEAAIAELGASIMMATPSMASLLRRERVPSLHHLWVMGETLNRVVANNFAADSPLRPPNKSKNLLNAYGPTEGSINCTLNPQVSSKQRGSIIGYPIPTCSIIILNGSDYRRGPVPLGFPGELAIGGPQVSAGYLNRPEQNASSFVDVAPYGRLYRTGDHARLVTDEKGALIVDFLGRMSSDQIKIAGKRVELGEIEAALLGPCVAEAAVVAMTSSGSAKETTANSATQLIAVIVPHESPTQNDILLQCRRQAERLLQPHMRPSKLYLLSRLPRTTSNKVDRKTLQQLCQSPEESGLIPLGLDGPTEDSPIDEVLIDETGFFERVLNTISKTVPIEGSRVMPSTTLASLGIDSLRAVRLLQHARDDGLPSLQITDVLSSRTIGQLAGKYQQVDSVVCKDVGDDELWQSLLEDFKERHETHCIQSLGYSKDQIESILPATTLQAVTLTSFVLTSGQSSSDFASSPQKSYIYHTVCEVAKGYDADTILRAWATVVSRHDIMRTVFVQVDDELTPFAQCLLSPSHPDSQIQATQYFASCDDEFGQLVEDAQAYVQRAMTLSKPPRYLSIVKSPSRNAIIFSMLHSLFDRGSLRLLLEDVEREYLNAPVISRSGPLTSARRHFMADREGAATFWNTYLEGGISPHFPCIRATIPGKDERDCEVASLLSELTMDFLQRKAAKMHSSPLAVLQTAWAVILFTYTGERDISFGSVVSDRFTDETQNCAAPVVTVHPIRIRLEPGESPRTIDITTARTEKNAEALGYLHAPISTAKYDTTFAFQSFADQSGEDLLYSQVSHPVMHNDQTMTIEVYLHRSGHIEFRATYQRSMVDAPAAKLMLTDLARITLEILENPERSFLECPFSLAGNTLNPTTDNSTGEPLQTPLSTDNLLLHSCFEKRARDRPNSLALSFYRDASGQHPPLEFTFQQLNRKAEQVASSLRRRLIGQQGPHIIPICMEKCPELYIAVLGVLKAGAAWCPIDPQYPPARQRILIERTSTGIVLTAQETVDRMAPKLPDGFEAINVATLGDQEVVPDESNSVSASAKPDDGVVQELQKTDIAYMIFTSGTTGTPKSVPITHEAASSSINSVVSFIDEGLSGEAMRCIQFVNFTFDPFVLDLFSTWMLGGTLISASRDILLGSLPTLTRTVAATHLTLTPSFASAIPIEELQSLRVVCMGGEKLPQALADRWKDRVSLYNVYGPAEAAIAATIRRVIGDARSTIIGRPLATVDAWVMQDGHPLITYGIGELVLAGPQLSPGYWRDPAKDEGKFVWNKFLQRRVYHTGDVVRQLSDGSFEFVGRNDDLVKIRGMRVELDEIAAVCSSGHSSIIHTAILVAKLPESSEDSIVCFLDTGTYQSDENSKPCIIVEEEATSITRAIAHHAASQLPRHMVPDVFIVLSSLPKNLSAKVDRKQLLDILASDWSRLPPPDAARNEDMLTDAEWHDQNHSLLDKIKRITKIQPSIARPSTTLAQLGIDSIGAVKLSSGLKADGHDISAIQILACQSIGDIISLLVGSNSEAEAGWKDAAKQFDLYWKPCVSEHLEGSSSKFRVAPSTPMQEGVLIETLREPVLYWANCLWNLSEHVDIVRLRQAWEKVVSLNEILRVGFFSRAYLDSVDTEGTIGSSTFFQVIYDSEPVQWVETTREVEDVQSFARSLIEEIAEKHHAQSFLSPPWQLTILTSGKSRTMILTIHHSLYDGEMLRYLLDDVAAAYTDLGYENKRCQLQEAATILSLRQNELTALPFWKEALRPFVSEPDFNTETTNSTHSTGPIVHRTTETRAHLSRCQLAHATKALGGSYLSSVIRVAYGSMLAELAESERILFAEIRSERVLGARLTDAMAPLVSTHPVPFTMDGTPEQLIQEQSELLSRSIECGPIHPGQIRKIIQKKTNEMIYPAVLVFHPSHQHEEGACTLWDEVSEVPDISVDHPIALNVFETSDDGIILSFSVDDSMMTAAAQDMFLRELDALLDNLVLHPKEPSIKGLTKYFPQSLLSISGNPRLGEYPVRNQPGYYIEQLAELHPEWRAVEIVTSFKSGKIQSVSWNFQKLNRVANQVAHFISDQSLREQRIGVSLDRTLLSFAIIVGVMKSGNTYVPIEVSLPAERKAFLLKDSGATIAFISGRSLQPDSLASETHIIDVDQKLFLDSLELKSTSNPTNQGSLDSEAYILYTSGSTGTPKGVRVSRQNMGSFLEGQSEFICAEAPKTRDLGGSGKYLCLASRAFDVHIGEMFLAWRHGMCALTGERLSVLDNLPGILKELRVTHASFVPSLLDQTGLTPSDTPDLVFLIAGGEKMTSRTQKIWSCSPQVSLINAYGPTEVTIGCCSGRMRLDSDTRNIGKPVGDSIAHILIPGEDVHVKIGMPGELAFVGSFVGNGYHNRPDAKGFCIFDGQWMYRTGDIVRMEPDGSIIFLGRKDDQVKVRGQRLELGEVSEAVRSASADPVDVATLLLKHPEIPRQLLVSFITDPQNESGTQAAFLPELFTKVNSNLRQACQIALPSYMVPDFILPVSFLPLAETSAKMDNKLLAKIFYSIPSSTLFNSPSNGVVSHPAPSRELTPREAKIAAAITTSIPRQEKTKVGPETSIFQLGVDSVSAVNISFKMKKLGFVVSVAQLLRNPTIEQLATDSNNVLMNSRHAELMANEVEKDLKALEDAVRKDLIALSWPEMQNVESIRPCLPLQEALVAHSLTHESTIDVQYINHMTFELGSDARVEEIRQAWELVLREHETLRTCFYFRDDNIVQVAMPADNSRMSWRSISGSPGELEQSLLNLRQEISHDIITKIDRIPPIRFTIASAPGSTDYQQSVSLMISMHHALYDMNSLEMVFKDFETAYAENMVPKRPSVTSLTQYIALQNRTPDRARQYWETELANRASTTQLTSSKAPKLSGRVFQSKLSTLESLCLKFDVKISALVQGIFGYVLCQTIREDDVTFGVVLSGRSIDVEGIENIAAPCITTIPQRLNLRWDGNTLHEIARTMQKRLFSSMEYQHTSLRSISAWLGVSGPLFSSIFSFIKTSSSISKSPEKRILKLSKGHMSLEYALAVECEANSAEDTLKLQAQSSLLDSFQDIDSILENIELLTNAFLQGEQIHVSTVTMSNKATDQPPDSSAEIDDTWSPCEDKIRDAIVSFSGIDRDQIKKDAPFIRFGIDSITTIRFSKLLREMGLQVSGADVIRNSSVIDLSRYITAPPLSQNGSASTNSDKQRDLTSFDDPQWGRGILWGIIPEEMLDRISNVYPLTPLQSAMIAATLAINPKLYSHHHPFMLPLDTDVTRLKVSWGRLLAKHDILRTSFIPVQQRLAVWVGAVHETPVLQWKEITTENVQKTMEKLFEEEEFKDVSSFTNPPVRATVVRSSSELIFIASLHHATYDGVSINFVFQDLWSLYNDLELQDRMPFYEAALAIRQSSQESIEFWTSHLQDYNSVQIPLTYEEEARNTLTLTTLRITDDIAPSTEWCLKEKVSTQTLVLFAVGKAVCSLVGARDVVFGQVLAGRIAIDGADNISGPMLNTLPFRLRMSESAASNLDVLKRLQEFQDRSLDYQYGPLMEIQRIWRDNSNSLGELSDILFVFQKDGEGINNVAWKKYIPPDSEETQPPSQYRLTIEVQQGSNGSLTITAFSTIAKERAEAFLELVAQCFTDAINSPDRLAIAFPPSLPDLPLQERVAGLQDSDNTSFQSEALDRYFVALSSILSEVTGTTQHEIQPQTSIFSIGIDSILAIRVALACRNEGVPLNTIDIIRNVMVGKLCEAALANSEAATPTISGGKLRTLPLVDDSLRELALSRLRKDESDVEIVLPVLSGQEYHLALWLQSGKTMYEPTWVFKTSQALDPLRLQLAWEALRRRHEVLRSCFVAVHGDQALQVVLHNTPDTTSNFSVHSVTAGTNLEETVKEKLRQIFRNPSSLYKPPVRLCLVQGGSEEDVVLFTIHHVAYDAWSMGVLVSELTALYNSLDALSDATLPSFSEFMQEIYISQQEAIESDKVFWETALGSSEPTLIGHVQPVNGLRSESNSETCISPKSHKKSSVMVDCSAITVDRIEGIARTRGITSHSILVASFARALAAATGSHSPVFGYYTAGRSTPFENIESLAGPTLNMLPIAVSNELIRPFSSGSAAMRRLQHFQEELSARVTYEQSNLRQVLQWAGAETSSVLYNAHLNILWNDEILVTSQTNDESLLRPWSLGVPADYASPVPLTLPSAVDDLDSSFLSGQALFVDVGSSRTSSGITIGAGCDADLLSEEELGGFLQMFSDEVSEIIEILSSG